MSCGIAVQADTVARWVDAEGRVHFGNPQFAPAGGGETLEVAPTNGMAVPKVPRSSGGDNARGLMISIPKAGKKNPRGWRGHSGRNAGGGGRTASGGRSAS
ncbi:MAG: hypothetical protein AAF513_09655 [Pseudomonadota bacterium]